MQRWTTDLGIEFDVTHMCSSRPDAWSGWLTRATVAGARSGRRLACALAVGALIAAGTLVTGPAYAKKFPPIAQKMYESAYAYILTLPGGAR